MTPRCDLLAGAHRTQWAVGINNSMPERGMPLWLFRTSSALTHDDDGLIVIMAVPDSL